MARNLTLDLHEFQQLILKSPEIAGRGAKKALDDIKDDWVLKSRNVAPLDTRNLRDQIKGEHKNQGQEEVGIMVTANARTNNFNYGYYIHEQDAGGKRLRLPSAEKKFLDKPAESNQSDWFKWIEEEVEDELSRGGW